MWKSKILLIFWVYLLLIPLCEASEQCVILLHGLGRTNNSMQTLAEFLKSYRYIVINQDYSSTKYPIKQLADKYIPKMVDSCLNYNVSSIHFVTHSLGGIVLREYLQSYKIPQLGRIVMLAPPNHGSQLADILQNYWLYRFVTGPAGQELTTDVFSLPNILNRVDSQYEIGIIAGDYNFIPFMKYVFHEANDGKVAVSSTRLDKMRDFIVLPVSHTFIMCNKLVMEQVVFFLNNGFFFQSNID